MMDTVRGWHARWAAGGLAELESFDFKGASRSGASQRRLESGSHRCSSRLLISIL
jgi:hypothetical protein